MNLSCGADARSLGLDRRKQINTLLIFNENVSEVSPNHSYRVDFQAGGMPLAMIIELPPEFPHQRPSVRIEPRGLSHPWLDPAGSVVGAPGLVSYSAHSDLGRVVQAIKRSLEREPPVRNQSALGSYANGHLPVSGVPPFVQYQGGLYRPAPPAPAAVVPYPRRPLAAPPPPPRAVISELSELSLRDLEELYGDEKALLNFVKSLKNPAMEAVDARFHELRGTLDSMLDESRGRVAETTSKVNGLKNRLEAKGHLADQVKALEGRVEEVRSKNTFERIGSELRALCAEDEEESERFAEEFLAGKTPVDQFLAEYVAVRSKHHARKGKLDDITKTNQQLEMFKLT